MPRLCCLSTARWPRALGRGLRFDSAGWVIHALPPQDIRCFGWAVAPGLENKCRLADMGTACAAPSRRVTGSEPLQHRHGSSESEWKASAEVRVTGGGTVWEGDGMRLGYRRRVKLLGNLFGTVSAPVPSTDPRSPPDYIRHSTCWYPLISTEISTVVMVS